MIKKHLYLLLLLFSCYIIPISATSTIAIEYTQVTLNNGLKPVKDSVQMRKFTPGFKQKYKEDKTFDYNQKQKQESTWQKIKAWLNQLLQKLFQPFQKNSDKAGSIFDIVLQILSYIAIFLLLFYIIKAFLKKDVYWFIKKVKHIPQTNEILTPEDLTTVNFIKLIDTEKELQNYRLCVRYYYLWLLQHLQNTQQIKWDINKTDTDYQAEIKNEATKKQYTYLVYLYKHIWYGEHQPSLHDFTKIESSFKAAIKD